MSIRLVGADPHRRDPARSVSAYFAGAGAAFGAGAGAAFGAAGAGAGAAFVAGAGVGVAAGFIAGAGATAAAGFAAGSALVAGVAACSVALAAPGLPSLAFGSAPLGGSKPSCAANAGPFMNSQTFLVLPPTNLSISTKCTDTGLPVFFNFIEGMSPVFVPLQVPVATT